MCGAHFLQWRLLSVSAEYLLRLQEVLMRVVASSREIMSRHTPELPELLLAFNQKMNQKNEPMGFAHQKKEQDNLQQVHLRVERLLLKLTLKGSVG